MHLCLVVYRHRAVERHGLHVFLDRIAAWAAGAINERAARVDPVLVVLTRRVVILCRIVVLCILVASKDVRPAFLAAAHRRPFDPGAIARVAVGFHAFIVAARLVVGIASQQVEQIHKHLDSLGYLMGAMPVQQPSGDQRGGSGGKLIRKGDLDGFRPLIYISHDRLHARRLRLGPGASCNLAFGPLL
jgi:hypothetical protein